MLSNGKADNGRPEVLLSPYRFQRPRPGRTCDYRYKNETEQHFPVLIIRKTKFKNFFFITLSTEHPRQYWQQWMNTYAILNNYRVSNTTLKLRLLTVQKKIPFGYWHSITFTFYRHSKYLREYFLLEKIRLFEVDLHHPNSSRLSKFLLNTTHKIIFLNIEKNLGLCK